MGGVILYATKYGSTRTYANWIAEATGLPAKDIRDGRVDLDTPDFFVIGLPVIYHALFQADWVRDRVEVLLRKPVILFTVSGAPAGEKLDGWIAKSLPKDFVETAYRVALMGRQDPRELDLYDRVMLIIAGLTNKDRKAGREELKGFDFMDKDSIQPVVDAVERLKRGDTPVAEDTAQPPRVVEMVR